MRLPFQKNKKVENTESALEKLSPGMVDVKDIVAPPAIEVDFNHIKIGDKYFRSLFVAGYPRFVSANWLAPLINFDHSLEVSMFHYPVETKNILDDLKRKVGEMEATIESDIKRGKVINPAVQVALDDALALQEELAKGAERFFQFGLYITVPADSLEELEETSRQVQSTLGSLLIVAKNATLQMEDGFKTTIPQALDKLMITRNMDTTSLATTFPFTSSELTENVGVLYGINEHNGSLIIFDRFALENYNEVVLGTAGGGKSFLIKLEALRYLMFGAELIIIDPESEYKDLCQAVGGEYISFSFNSSSKINPFDLSGVYEEGENELGMKILTLHSLFKIIMGKLNPTEDAILDRALVQTYRNKGITPDPQTQKLTPPLMEDLYKTLVGMEQPEAVGLASRIEKFVKGSLVGIFDRQSNININNPFTVFSIRELEDELRPIAMFIILDYIWTKVKKDLKKRILVVDEAWYLMRYPDSATFLYGICKRSRKYYLGVTTITQDIEDFLSGDFGKAIITNSAIKILLKQSTAAIDKLGEIFYLSEGEKTLLLSSEIGEGIFFAGQSHAAMQVIASPEEYQVITTRPEDILARRNENAQKQPAQQNTNNQVTPKTSSPQNSPFVNHPIPGTQVFGDNKNPTETTPTSSNVVDPKELDK